MKNNADNKFPLAGQRLYPHLKLTRERFPRLLVTRKIEPDAAEYFGAFLPETGVRFLLDFINKIFRLRTCEIEIDGNFSVPCTQFYRKRCVAPCVESLCDEKEYSEQVELVRLFLQRKTAELEKRFLRKIETYAEELNFEKASETRDAWQAIEKIYARKDWNFWLEDAVDTFEIEETNESFLVYLATMRGRKTLGRRVFVFEKKGNIEDVLPEILPQFYRFHAPKEIRVSDDFPERFFVANELSKRFGRKIKIAVSNDNSPRVFAGRAITRAKYEHEFRLIKPAKSTPEIQKEFQQNFNLSKLPRRIEGFDVAHISGSDFVAAKSVWENGKYLGKEYEFWFSDEKSELETLQKFIEIRFSRKADESPDLILIDGGKSHLQAALKASENIRNRNFTIVSAVKPPRRHGEISHFLTETNEKIEFSAGSAAHNILQILRDEAHNLSNQIHRQKREMAHFYELAEILPSLGEKERRQLLQTHGSVKNVLALNKNGLTEKFPVEKINLILSDLENYKNGNSKKIQPLIVPLRFDDENGDAKDLQLLSTYK